ncbi:MAG: hypothetical protein LBP53_06665 [Candidatus Peribacteria bacterium]|nr:hypothetical protein [Candidatus Peribacteria bacterium]
MYRDLGVLNAGETRMYGFTITIPCDTMNATTYLTHATIAGTLADRYDTAPISTTISAQARPALTKNAQGVFSYENKNYLYLAYNPTLTYVITAHNSGGTEAINKPVITDNLSYLQSQFATGCGALSLAERISDISDGGILSGTTLTWNLANIGRNQKKAVSYKVNFSGCNINGTQFTNTAQLSAKNISPLSASYTIQLLNQLSPGIAYFKTILGTTKLYYEDMVTYQLQLRNI